MIGTSKVNRSVVSIPPWFQPSKFRVLLLASRSVWVWFMKSLACTVVYTVDPASRPELASFWLPPSRVDRSWKPMSSDQVAFCALKLLMNKVIHPGLPLIVFTPTGQSPESCSHSKVPPVA